MNWWRFPGLFRNLNGDSIPKAEKKASKVRTRGPLD